MAIDISPRFTVSLRGYDKDEVEHYLESVSERSSQTDDQLFELQEQARFLEEENERLGARVDELETAIRSETPHSVSALGERITLILTEAEEGASDTLTQAKAQSEYLVAEAQKEADALRRQASASAAQAAETLTLAQRQAEELAERLEAEARARAATVLGDAELRAQRRQEQIEGWAQQVIARTQAEQARLVEEFGTIRRRHDAEVRALLGERDDAVAALRSLQTSLGRAVDRLPTGRSVRPVSDTGTVSSTPPAESGPGAATGSGAGGSATAGNGTAPGVAPMASVRTPAADEAAPTAPTTDGSMRTVGSAGAAVSDEPVGRDEARALDGPAMDTDAPTGGPEATTTLPAQTTATDATAPAPGTDAPAPGTDAPASTATAPAAATASVTDTPAVTETAPATQTAAAGAGADTTAAAETAAPETQTVAGPPATKAKGAEQPAPARVPLANFYAGRNDSGRHTGWWSRSNGSSNEHAAKTVAAFSFYDDESESSVDVTDDATTDGSERTSD